MTRRSAAYSRDSRPLASSLWRAQRYTRRKGRLPQFDLAPQVHLAPLLDGASYRPSEVMAFEDEPQAQPIQLLRTAGESAL